MDKPEAVYLVFAPATEREGYYEYKVAETDPGEAAKLATGCRGIVVRVSIVMDFRP